MIDQKLDILLISLSSPEFPAIGESHGISVIAGAIKSKLHSSINTIEVIDLVAFGENSIIIIKEYFEKVKPNIIGFSINYGTYSVLRELWTQIRHLISERALCLFGGAIPTYIPEAIFSISDMKNTVIVLGEGDIACPAVISSWLNNKSYNGISNICYIKNDIIKTSDKILVPKKAFVEPFREHIPTLVEKKVQIFTESSRGCSWGVCSFCSRGLTDAKGHGDEYRRLPIERLKTDLLNLKRKLVSSVTYADEDFGGGNLNEFASFVERLSNFSKANNINIPFDVSMSVHSIYADNYSESELKKRKTVIKKLKKIGLRKIFLGIESGSRTQLDRYHKSHKPNEALNAIAIIKEIGINVELGFIMFDPLCNLEEVECNFNYISDNNLLKHISFFSNELRLCLGSKYLNTLQEYETKVGLKLYNRNLDYDTLSYSYTHASDPINELLRHIRKWNFVIRKYHYPLNNLSRYGTGGILGKERNTVVGLVLYIRECYFALIFESIIKLKAGNLLIDIDKKMSLTVKKISKRIISEFSCSQLCQIDNPIIRDILQLCNHDIDN